jgi:hypothetical protein
MHMPPGTSGGDSVEQAQKKPTHSTELNNLHHSLSGSRDICSGIEKSNLPPCSVKNPYSTALCFAPVHGRLQLEAAFDCISSRVCGCVYLTQHNF